MISVNKPRMVSRTVVALPILRSMLGNMRDDIFGEDTFLGHLDLNHLGGPERENSRESNLNLSI